MTTIIAGQTATILQFPTGGRQGWIKNAGTNTLAQPAPTSGPQVEFSDLAFGGSWYHEDALHDAEIPPVRTN